MGGPVKPKLNRADELLRARESRVLVWSFGARLASLLLSAVLDSLHLLGVIPAGIAAESDLAAWGTFALTAVSSVLVFGGLLDARRGRRLSYVGYGAVVLDTLFLAALVILWWHTSGSTESSPAFLAKGEIVPIGMLMVAINAMALRPAYPALMTLGVFIIHTALCIFVLNHPDITLTSSYVSHQNTSSLNPGVLFIRTQILLTVGVSLTLLARTARRTIHDAVALEISNLEIKERQMDMVSESKISAVRTLVAGISHEMNTPSGVIRSSVDTIVRCGEKLDGNQKILGLMKESGAVAQEAVERLSSFVRSLQDFARLDQAEVQPTDLRQSLDGALALISPEVRGQVTVDRQYEDIPTVWFRAQELNQVFFTLLSYLFEEMAGNGTLLLKSATAADHFAVEIVGSGPSLSPDELAVLFDIGFSAGQGRMTMELGPPVARQIIERNGGALIASSEPGAGTTFTVSLPRNLALDADPPKE